MATAETSNVDQLSFEDASEATRGDRPHAREGRGAARPVDRALPGRRPAAAPLRGAAQGRPGADRADRLRQRRQAGGPQTVRCRLRPSTGSPHALDAEAKAVSAEVDRFFAELLSPPGDSRERFYEAMRHAAIGGGKRLRPLLTVAASRLFAIDRERALRVGCAIEAIHVYSLVHDDLPCMDDAELRRGQADGAQGVRRGGRGARRRQPARAGVRDPRASGDPRGSVGALRPRARARSSGRAERHGRRTDDGPRRGGRGARPSVDHPPPAAQDRRADRILRSKLRAS